MNRYHLLLAIDNNRTHNIFLSVDFHWLLLRKSMLINLRLITTSRSKSAADGSLPSTLFALLEILSMWEFQDSLWLVSRPRSENSAVTSRVVPPNCRGAKLGERFFVIRIYLHFFVLTLITYDLADSRKPSYLDHLEPIHDGRDVEWPSRFYNHLHTKPPNL